MDTPSPEVLAIGDAVVTTIKKNLPNIGATLLAVGVVLGI